MDGAATLLAVTVIVVLVDTTGAVNKPEGVIVPAVAVQVTLSFVVSATVAMNCLVAPEETDARVGETATEIG